MTVELYLWLWIGLAAVGGFTFVASVLYAASVIVAELKEIRVAMGTLLKAEAALEQAAMIRARYSSLKGKR